MKAKSAQFAKGAVFLWPPANAGQAEEHKKAIFAELKTFLTAPGMSLEEQPTPK